MNTFFIVLFLAFLILWGIAWRNQTRLAFGIFIGIGVGWLVSSLVKGVSLEHIPLWLPPLPFAVVAVTLFGFGVAAWRIGSDPGSAE
jgi:hypothetical protein